MPLTEIRLRALKTKDKPYKVADVAGVLAFLHQGEEPLQEYSKTAPESLQEGALAELLDRLPSVPMLAGEGGARLSLAGAQSNPTRRGVVVFRHPIPSSLGIASRPAAISKTRDSLVPVQVCIFYSFLSFRRDPCRCSAVRAYVHFKLNTDIVDVEDKGVAALETASLFF